jgi:hypothetical protein
MAWAKIDYLIARAKRRGAFGPGELVLIHRAEVAPSSRPLAWWAAFWCALWGIR